jgi:hypothetical protein
VSIPTTNIQKSNLEANIGLDELRHLEEPLSELAAGIARAVFGLEALRISVLKQLYGIERGILPHGFEGRVEISTALSRVRATDIEVLDASQSQRGSRSHQGTRHFGVEGDRTEGVGIFLRRALHVSIEPTVGDAFVARGSSLHIVLRVEMGARIVGGPDGMNDCQVPLVIDGLQRAQRRMESEESIQIDCRVGGAIARSRDSNLRPSRSIVAIPVGCHYRYPVRSATLEDGDQNRSVCARSGACRLRQCRADQKRRRRRETCHSESGRFQKITP